MPTRPSRRLQIACALVAAAGFAPWAFNFGNTVLRAIHSEAPLFMSVAAWLILLVPLWVVWFAAVAWRERNSSAVPAVLMALPAVLMAGIGLMRPLANLIR